MHFYPSVRRKRRWRYPSAESSPAFKSYPFQVYVLTLDFFRRKLTAFSKPPSGDGHRSTQGRKKVTRVQAEPILCDQSRRKHCAFTHSQTMRINVVKNDIVF